METKYQEIFEQITSDKILESIFPGDKHAQKVFKSQIEKLLRSLDGEEIEENHKNDYKYNIKKMKI